MLKARPVPVLVLASSTLKVPGYLRFYISSVYSRLPCRQSFACYKQEEFHHANEQLHRGCQGNQQAVSEERR